MFNRFIFSTDFYKKNENNRKKNSASIFLFLYAVCSLKVLIVNFFVVDLPRLNTGAATWTTGAITGFARATVVPRHRPPTRARTLASGTGTVPVYLIRLPRIALEDRK